MSKITQRYWHDFIDCAEEYRIPGKKLAKLDNFLRTKSRPGGCSSLAMADGFLTALAVGPSSITRHPRQGLELVWGDTSMTCLDLPQHSQDYKMTTVMCKRLAVLSYQIERARQNYRPLIFGDFNLASAIAGDEDDVDDALRPVIEWCHGFMNYVRVTSESWEPIFKTKRGRKLIGPIVYFGTKTGWPHLKDDGREEYPFQNDLPSCLSHYVFGVKDYFSVPIFAEDMTEFLADLAPKWSVPKSAALLR